MCVCVCVESTLFLSRLRCLTCVFYSGWLICFLSLNESRLHWGCFTSFPLQPVLLRLSCRGCVDAQSSRTHLSTLFLLILTFFGPLLFCRPSAYHLHFGASIVYIIHRSIISFCCLRHLLPLFAIFRPLFAFLAPFFVYNHSSPGFSRCTRQEAHRG